MQIGTLILPEHSWSEAKPLWQRAEALGFHHAWTYDHLAWRTFRDKPWFTALPLLTAAAMVTSAMRLGTMVASPNFRHPLLFAKELIALDDISEGRIILGIGAGSTGWDATMLGQEPWSTRERFARFAEFVELTELLLRQPATSYAGTYYSVNEARTYPGCVQQPRLPLALAGTGRIGMTLAARFGQIWVTNGARDQENDLPGKEGAALVSRQMKRLDDICHSLGRDPQTLRRLVLSGSRLSGGLASPTAFADTLGHYQEIGVTDFVVHWPRPEPPHQADLATFEKIFSERRF